jgi:hypothetical protein
MVKSVESDRLLAVSGKFRGPSTRVFVCLILCVLGCVVQARPQSPDFSLAGEAEALLPDDPSMGAGQNGARPEAPPQISGTVSGTVVDGTGAEIAGARVMLVGEGGSAIQGVASDQDGQFLFTNVAPGTFQLKISAAGFAPQTFSGTLRPGEFRTVEPIALPVATAVTEVQVSDSPAEVAQEQIKAQEKQRVLGVIPNFYISYVPDAAPLNTKQKFELAWKTTIDPVSFALIGAVAGVQQANNSFSGYGQGAQGYGKRYGASYADFVAGTFVGGAVLPSLLKQDPRYFYRGTGTRRSRLLYALANAVICKGDNGKWQPNYSNMLGGLAAGGISNLYYPAKDRNGARLTFENALIEIGATAGANLVEEFLVPRPTPKSSKPKKP